MSYETALDDFLAKDGKELPKDLQKPQVLLKLPKGAMSIFIKDDEAIYRYDGKCYEGRREDAITNLVFLLRLKEYLEVAKHLKPKFISKAYDDDIFVIAVKEPIAKNIDEKMKFEELIVKLEIYDEDFKIRDLSDFEPTIPNEIVEEAIYRKDFCFSCGIFVEDGSDKVYYYDEEFGGAIICGSCYYSFEEGVDEVEEPAEPTEEQLRREREELRKYEERKEKKEDTMTKEEREEYFKEQWSSFWASMKEEEPIGEQYVANEVEEKAIEEKKEETKPAEESKILKIYFNNAKDFFEILRLLEVINDYAGFIIDNEGLKYCQMDPSHVSLISAKFKAKIENIEECKFSLDVRDFTKGVSNEELRNMKNSNLMLEVDLTNKKARIFSAINIEGEILDEEVNDALEPKMVFDVEAEIDLKYLLNAIKGFETIKISVENDRLYVEARNEMVKKKSFIPSKLNSFRNGTLAYYNVHYIEKFLKKAVKLTKIAKLSFSHNKPLCIAFETKTALISYYLAPKVEE